MYVQAADGWLDLGNLDEANAELQKISPAVADHPQVLEARWQILSRGKEWEACVRVSKLLLQLDPERVSGWLNYSFALHEMKRTKEAWDSLFSVAEKFPEEPTLAYNLACYAAQLGRLWEAEQWLKQAFNLGQPAVLKSLALRDEDLRPLWPKIDGL